MELILPLCVLGFAVFHTVWMSKASAASSKAIFEMLKDERQRWVEARSEDHAREISFRQQIANLERAILESELADQYLKKAGKGKNAAALLPPQLRRPDVTQYKNGLAEDHPRILVDEGQ